MANQPRLGADFHNAPALPSAARKLGLPDDAFEQERPLKGLITKSEIRAVSLYQLGLFREAVVWDIGAGTGSVALEAALVACEGKVFAVERSGAGIANLRKNVARLSQGNVEIVEGEAPKALELLPPPDCVFIGGSGGRLRAIIEYIAAHLNEDGRIVVNLAAMERAVEAQSLLVSNGMDAHTVMVNVSRGKPLPDGTTRFEALNPVFVVTATSPTGRL